MYIFLFYDSTNSFSSSKIKQNDPAIHKPMHLKTTETVFFIIQMMSSNVFNFVFYTVFPSGKYLLLLFYHLM